MFALLSPFFTAYKGKIREEKSIAYIASMFKQTLTICVYLNLLQRNKDFPIPHDETNKMISRFLLLVPSFTKKEAFKIFMEFFNNTQIFHPLFSMLYTGNLGLCYCVGFLQIWSQIL